MFVLLTLRPDFVTDSLTHATGRSFSLDDVMTIGARIAALRTAFNLREGIRNVEIDVPRRGLGDPPLPHGPTAGRTVDLQAQVEDYLEAMGWDPKTGVPRQETLIGLGLDFVAADLQD
ncbi:MAG: aldehyde ferredoxin oxidoreductase C-terminal domain-containing protein, partial [Planctomycetota bacterium]|jgi:aldehyde:ferredoxin oxidoreductase